MNQPTSSINGLAPIKEYLQNSIQATLPSTYNIEKSKDDPQLINNGIRPGKKFLLLRKELKDQKEVLIQRKKGYSARSYLSRISISRNEDLKYYMLRPYFKQKRIYFLDSMGFIPLNPKSLVLHGHAISRLKNSPSFFRIGWNSKHAAQDITLESIGRTLKVLKNIRKLDLGCSLPELYSEVTIKGARNLSSALKSLRNIEEFSLSIRGYHKPFFSKEEFKVITSAIVKLKLKSLTILLQDCPVLNQDGYLGLVKVFNKMKDLLNLRLYVLVCLIDNKVLEEIAEAMTKLTSLKKLALYFYKVSIHGPIIWNPIAMLPAALPTLRHFQLEIKGEFFRNFALKLLGQAIVHAKTLQCFSLNLQHSAGFSDDALYELLQKLKEIKPLKTVNVFRDPPNMNNDFYSKAKRLFTDRPSLIFESSQN